MRAWRIGLFLLALSPLIPRAMIAAAGKQASLGINLAGFSYWSDEWMFLDLVKRCSEWRGKRGTDYTVDADGWINWLAPGKRAVAMVGDTVRNFPLGRYVALYKGKGEVALECLRCVEVSRAPGRVVVDVVESPYVWIVIHAVDPADYVRDLRVVPIEHEATHLTQPFHPRFLEGLKPFAAVRYNGVQNTNGSPQERWSDRTKPTSVFQDAPGGVALEYLVQLSNISATDPWFCIPPRADDDYVRNFARTVFAHLGRDRKIYLEYGNEIWNEGDSYGRDGDWMTERARALKLPLGPGDDGSPMTYRLRYQVVRSRQIFDIFWREMDALGVDKSRLVRVIASQASYFDRIRFTLDYRFPDGTRAYQHADALAVAPYFAGFWMDELPALAEKKWSVSQILDFAECSAANPARPPPGCSRIPYDAVGKAIRADAEIARTRGLRLLGYEGGQHMVASNGDPAFVNKLAAVNRSPRMKAIYRQYFETWHQSGGELLFLVSYVRSWGRHGYWGMLERQDQPSSEAPKFEAAVEFSSTEPRWWKEPGPALQR